MKDKRYLIFITILCSIAYLFFLLIINTVFKILDIHETAISLLAPLVVILVFITILQISFCISLSAFRYVYIFTGTVCGHAINTFFLCVLYKMCNLVFSFSTLNALLFSLGIPLLISIYGLINGYIIQLDKITLIYHDFPSKRKICHLSDLHLGSIYQKGTVQKVVNKVMEINPDVVVITGDLADGSENVKSEWLKPFNSLSMPILFITGNHEVLMGTKLLLKEVSETNIKHIGLSSTPFTAGGIVFWGVDYEENLRQRLNEFPRQLNSNYPTVLLSHVPKLKPEDLKDYNIFLHLCGHTHSGQLFPFQPLAWLGNKCFNGLYSTNNDRHHVYVSSGIGCSTVPMRILSTPTIGVISIQG